MTDTNITKMLLANSLKDLMNKEEFDKISVDDIVKNCELTRQTFYYHFKDKYDLMNWIYYNETKKFMINYNKIENWTDGLKDICLYIQKNKTFYINALNTKGQNSFPEYLHDYITEVSTSVIKNVLSQEYDSRKWKFVVEFFSTSLVGIIIHWANDNMEEDSSEYIDQIKNIFDGNVYYELQKSNRFKDKK